MDEIEYKTNVPIEAQKIIELYRNAGLPRPIDDFKRIEKMFANSNLVISAWKEDELIGISRSLTDFSWCCYLADLAVRKDFQKAGVGRKLVEITRETVGENSNILLLSVPDAMNYYSKIGMEKVENGFIINRKN
jgi:GNAT superfamily N-acetyltransferase